VGRYPIYILQFCLYIIWRFLDASIQRPADAEPRSKIDAPDRLRERYLGEALLPVLSPDLMRRRPLRTPVDLARQTLLHSETLRTPGRALADPCDTRPRRTIRAMPQFRARR